MKHSFFLALTLSMIVLLPGCGRESWVDLLGERENACPLYFASENLCAEITWVKGPSSDTQSSLNLIFWNKDSGSSSGPLTEPVAQVGAFLRMTCCGSISFPKTTKVGPGFFTVSEINFTPGNLEVYIQLKQGEQVEKKSVKVQVDE